MRVGLVSTLGGALRSRRARFRRIAVIVAALASGGQGTCTFTFDDPSDLMLHTDPVDQTTRWVAEILPGAPWILPGPDGRLGTSDDPIVPILGDDDLVLRTGYTSFSGPIPEPSAANGTAPIAVAEPFSTGIPVPFVVSAVSSSDGVNVPVDAPSLEGAPILVVAFADVDFDGFVGMTNLDGDPLDNGIEEAELIPVGRRFAIAQSGRAAGTLFSQVGGPAEAPATIVLTASAYAGAFDPDFFSGAVPRGPAVMTRMPFFPRSDPDELIDAGGGGLLPADPDAREAVEIEPAWTPNPSDPVLGEVFVLRIDGSEETIDTARADSGAFARWGFGLSPDPNRYRALLRRPLRVGLDDAGAAVPYEILQHLSLADDGPAGTTVLRVLPLDRLGNVTDPEVPAHVTVRSVGQVRIVAPDTDGDPTIETLRIETVRGADLEIDDSGGVFDDGAGNHLIVEGSGAVYRLDVSLPDPDVDDSQLVDATDVAIVEMFDGLELGEDGFDPRFDVNGDGSIDAADVDAVESHQGTVVPVP
jgi:hypothetical protein